MRSSPRDYENKKPQITLITQIFFLRVPWCHFVANFLVILMVVPHDAAPSPGNE